MGNTRRTLSLLATLTPTYKPFCLQLVELEKKGNNTSRILSPQLDMNPLSLLRDGSPVIVGETITHNGHLVVTKEKKINFTISKTLLQHSYYQKILKINAR